MNQRPDETSTSGNPGMDAGDSRPWTEMSLLEQATAFPRTWRRIVDRWISGHSPDYPTISPSRSSVLRQLEPITMVNNIVVLTTPNQWAKQQVENDLAGDIREVLGRELGQSITLSLSVQEKPAGQDGAQHPTGPVERGGHTGPADGSMRDRPHGGSRGSDPGQYPDVRGTDPGRATRYLGEHSPAGPDADAAARHAREFEARPERDQGTVPAPKNWKHLQQPHSPQPSPDHPDGSPLRGGHPLGGESRSHRSGDRSAVLGRSPAIDEIPLNRKYTFETFVMAQSNQLACAAARSVAEFPARTYNPLFIYGESGLGKTHLLHAISHYAQELRPDMKVRYISSEALTNDFINSIANDTREAFKRRYRELDMLIVDDIQFLVNKESTQEEFFHTFNALHEANKQIVLSSDQHPRQLTTLEDRLRTRFEGGLIADIHAPDLETRIAILTRKAKMEGKALPEDVARFIASIYHTSIRELEGAFIRVTAYCSLSQVPVSVEAAEIALRNNMPSGGDVIISATSIIEAVAEHYGLVVNEIIGKGRTRKVAHARQVAIYLCRELTDLSLPKLGVEFGGRDHSTVLYAERRIRESLDKDRQTFEDIQVLSQKIKKARY